MSMWLVELPTANWNFGQVKCGQTATTSEGVLHRIRRYLPSPLPQKISTICTSLVSAIDKLPID